MTPAPMPSARHALGSFNNPPASSRASLPRSEGFGLIEGDEGKVRLTCKDLSV
jgi:hypothetical protein